MVKRDNSLPSNSEQVCSSAWVGYCSQSTATPHFFCFSNMVLCHWRTGESFNWKWHKILSTRYDHFKECRGTNYKDYEAPFPSFFFINILVIISFCLSQCRKPNGRPSFNHMQRNSYLKTGQIQGYKYALLFGHPNYSMNNFQIIYHISHYQPL